MISAEIRKCMGIQVGATVWADVCDIARRVSFNNHGCLQCLEAFAGETAITGSRKLIL
jgi:hypothetical protein